jgi:hypothetical protein
LILEVIFFFFNNVSASNVVLPPEVFDAVVNEIKKQVGNLVSPFSDKVWSGDECIPEDTDINIHFPDFVVTLRSPSSHLVFDLIIPPSKYFAKAPLSQCDNGIEGYAFSIGGMEGQGIILGQPFFESFYIVHDLDSRKIGFALLDGCDESHETSVRPPRIVQRSRSDIETSAAAATWNLVDPLALAPISVVPSINYFFAFFIIALAVFFSIRYNLVSLKHREEYQEIPSQDDRL